MSQTGTEPSWSLQSNSLDPTLVRTDDWTTLPDANGEWNAFTGNSTEWRDWSVDLSAYAGQQVELSISYVTDFAEDGLGMWVDDDWARSQSTVEVGAAITTEDTALFGFGLESLTWPDRKDVVARSTEALLGDR